MKKSIILHQQEVKYPQYEEQIEIGSNLYNLDNLGGTGLMVYGYGIRLWRPGKRDYYIKCDYLF